MHRLLTEKAQSGRRLFLPIPLLSLPLPHALRGLGLAFPTSGFWGPGQDLSVPHGPPTGLAERRNRSTSSWFLSSPCIRLG